MATQSIDEVSGASIKEANGRIPMHQQQTRPPAYLHVTAVHCNNRTSCLSHESESAPSFVGFRNLMILVLIFMNLRLVMENFMKYGVLICIRCHNYQRQDLILAAILYAMVPAHLYVAYAIESRAARKAKAVIAEAKKLDQKPSEVPSLADSFRAIWKSIAIAHSVNATLALLITNATVYYYIYHPLLGTISEVHAIIVWLKICSYAFTNRDLRSALLEPEAAASLPPIYSECPYPNNITLGNLSYFWWAPTLVYQPVYPRTPNIRWSLVGKRVAECISLSIFIWLASAQYAAPLLHNSLFTISAMNVASIAERLMKLSTISAIVWLAGFFAIFHSALNALAEIMQFGDREFYTDWWNSPGVGTYWRTWNKPVYSFLRRHVYTPLLGRGWSSRAAGIWVFVFSGVLHELLVGVPTHNILGVAFLGMVIQVPLILLTQPLEKMEVVDGTDNTPLPPSVEEAYRRKCIDLKQRTKEVEESNDAARARKERLNRGIRKMRLERAFLLEMLGKRMKKTGVTSDGVPTFYESESDGSSEGPPTPQERPTRTKKAHRRPVASTPPTTEYTGGQQQQSSNYQSMIYEQPSHQHESPYGPQSSTAPSNGQQATQNSPSRQSSLRQPAVLASQGSSQTRSQSSANRHVTSIPAPSAFAMFFENNYLSQPHKHSGVRTDSDLEALALEHWDSPDHADSRKKFEAQAAKRQARYEQAVASSFDGSTQTKGTTVAKVVTHSEDNLEGGSRGGGASDVDMSDVDGKSGGVSFRSVN